MLRYIGKRIIGVIPTLIIVVTFVFFFVRLIPGDPARLVAGPQATLEDVQVVREELGLDKPIHEQYITYVTGLLKGDLGTSLRTKRPVAVEVSNRCWPSHGAPSWVCFSAYGPEDTEATGRITQE